MPSLFPELATFASILDAQPAPARDAFNYCLALLMVEVGVVAWWRRFRERAG